MKVKLLDHKEISFPSGSGIEFHEEKIYLVGDDAKEILVLNKNWKELDRISVFESSTDRIAKDLKADMEATTIVEINKIPRLLVLGSGSMVPHRNRAFLFNLDDKTREEFPIDIFYNRLKNNGLADLNIESASIILGKLVLGNRGNISSPSNYLITADINVWKDQENEEIRILPFVYPQGSPDFAGLSGMTYSPQNDWLIITLSTENTKDSVNDGKIGDSYLGVIENASSKMVRKKIKIDELINLSDVDDTFRRNKIESVCIQSDKDAKVKLHLVADNDNGQSVLFKIRLKE
jgi:hypothetical protein